MVGNGITGEMGAKIYKDTTQKGEQLITDKVSLNPLVPTKIKINDMKLSLL